MNYTALGATINLGARLEGLNKNYGTQVLVSEAVKVRAESAFIFRSVDQIKPKGFAEAVSIHELVGERDSIGEPMFCQRWNAVYSSIWNDGTSVSLAGVVDYLAEYPQDGIAKYHFERLRTARDQQRKPISPDIQI
jgi:adenylate cyclase